MKTRRRPDHNDNNNNTGGRHPSSVNPFATQFIIIVGGGRGAKVSRDNRLVSTAIGRSVATLGDSFSLSLWESLPRTNRTERVKTGI